MMIFIGLSKSEDHALKFMLRSELIKKCYQIMRVPLRRRNKESSPAAAAAAAAAGTEGSEMQSMLNPGNGTAKHVGEEGDDGGGGGGAESLHVTC